MIWILFWIAAWSLFTLVWLRLTRETTHFLGRVTAQRRAFAVTYYILAALTFFTVGVVLLGFENFSFH
mgnify:CR=1 FL=1